MQQRRRLGEEGETSALCPWLVRKTKNKESTNQTNHGMNDVNGGVVAMGCGVGVVAGVGMSDIDRERRQHHHGGVL